MAKQGKLITNGCITKTHEQTTINYLLSKGYNIELIRTSSIPGCHSADIRINGVAREIKAPLGDSQWTMARNLRHGKRQSSRVIVDLFRFKRSEPKSIRELEKEFHLSMSLIEMWIITKKRAILVYNKKK